MIYNALESREEAVQLLAVGIIPDFKHAIQYTAMKNDMIPRIQALCLKTGSDNVRISCLVCMGKLLEVMDKWLVHEALLPMLGQIKSRAPGVLMAVLGIFHALLQGRDKYGLDAGIIAGKVIPFMAPMMITPELNPTQVCWHRAAPSMIVFAVHGLPQPLSTPVHTLIASSGCSLDDLCSCCGRCSLRLNKTRWPC